MPTEDRVLVDDLAAPHRARGAYKRLMTRGQEALPAILEGLAHPSADARYHCCRLLFIGTLGQGEFTDRFGRKTVYQFNLLLFGVAPLVFGPRSSSTTT
jgi:hypothetical protein